MTNKPTKIYCSEEVWGSGDFRPHRCGREATITENGKPYCKTHAPSEVARRRAVSQAVEEAKWAACIWMEKNRREVENKRKLAAFDDLLAACEALRDFASDFSIFGDDIGQTMLQVVNAAIAKAKKEVVA